MGSDAPFKSSSHEYNLVIENYKSNSFERSGKLLVEDLFKGLRHKQILVLKYFHEYPLNPASPSMITQYIRQKYSYEFKDKKEYILFCKKIHDTLNTLVKRKLLYKVKRGLYYLTDLGKQLLSYIVHRMSDQQLEKKLYKNNGIEKELEETNREIDLADCCGVGRVLRFHVVSGGVLDSVDRLVVGVEVVYRYVVFLRRFLRRVVGVSRYRRISSRVRVVFNGFPVVGSHGFYGSGDRVLRPLYVFNGREVGVDVPVVIDGVDKVHVKVYSSDLKHYIEYLNRYVKPGSKRLSEFFAR